MSIGGKIYDEEQVNWFASDTTVLDYRMLFNKDDESLPTAEEQIKSSEEEVIALKELLNEREREFIKELDSVKSEAYSRGLEEGREKGRQSAEAEIDKKIIALEEVLKLACDDWKEQQEMLKPGLLDLGFDIAESILGIPVENPAIRQRIDTELANLLPKIEEQSKPALKVAQEDYEYIAELIAEYAATLPILIRADETCNPGEFELETNREALVLRFKTMLADFKESLTLPSWK